MKLGVALPHFGPAASPQAIIDVAREAESLGFASVWVLDRLLWPVKPRSKYPGNPRGELPAPMQNTYDPFVVLSFAAAHTERLLLGTSVLVAAYRAPAVTAKMTATLDVLSGGRLILGLGVGWSADEFVAAGHGLEERNQQCDEFIQLLRQLWQSEEISFEGTYYRVPRSRFLPKPVQKPSPPIWIGGNSERAMRRVAAYGDGWHPTSRMAVGEMTAKMARIRELAAQQSRDPGAVALTVRWNGFPDLEDAESRRIVGQRLREYEAAGVEHICIDFNIPAPVTTDFLINQMGRLMTQIVPSL